MDQPNQNELAQHLYATWKKGTTNPYAHAKIEEIWTDENPERRLGWEALADQLPQIVTEYHLKRLSKHRTWGKYVSSLLGLLAAALATMNLVGCLSPREWLNEYIDFRSSILPASKMHENVK